MWNPNGQYRNDAWGLGIHDGTEETPIIYIDSCSSQRDVDLHSHPIAHLSQLGGVSGQRPEPRDDPDDVPVDCSGWVVERNRGDSGRGV